MRRSIVVAVLAMLLAISMATVSSAKNNSLSLTGSFGSTFLGLEYERRIGHLGVGLEASTLMSFPYYQEFEALPLRVNGLLRYYIGDISWIKPYISLAPGALFSFFPVEPAQVDYNLAFNMHATAGIEITPGKLRVAAEAGYEFVTVFLYPEPVSEGWFFVKAAVGIRF